MAATILIIEDEYAVARGIQYALQQEGYQVSIARSGEEGLEFATHEAPDLVVLDVRLPGIDGFEVLRRAYGDLADASGGRLLRHGDLLIDLERRRVQRGQRRITLTATEFEILRHLASRPGRVYSRRELLELIRDYEALDQDEKTINVHVSHLREKLEDDPSKPRFVLTVRGAGYAFAER